MEVNPKLNLKLALLYITIAFAKQSTQILCCIFSKWTKTRAETAFTRGFKVQFTKLQPLIHMLLIQSVNINIANTISQLNVNQHKTSQKGTCEDVFCIFIVTKHHVHICELITCEMLVHWFSVSYRCVLSRFHFWIIGFNKK